MGSHISTSETFLRDAPEIKIKCPLCGIDGPALVGWVEIKCLSCNLLFSLDDTLPDLVRRQRQAMGLTRRQMGQLTGYSPKTIKRYEWVECSLPYRDAARRAFLDHLPTRASTGEPT